MQVMHRKRYGSLFVFLLIIMFAVFPLAAPHSVYADEKGHSWTEGAGDEIYADENGLVEDSAESEEEDEPGFIEKALSSLFVALGDGLNSLLEFAGVSLDKIICGRVGSGSTKASQFTFELIDGNAFGTIGAIAYSVLRACVFVWMVFILGSKMTRAMWSSGNGQARNAFKDSLAVFFLSFSLLFLAPYLLDLWLFIRDSILYLVKTNFLDVMGKDSSLTLVGAFRETAESGRITDAIMYDGAVGITLWFLFDYIGMALSMLLFFAMFPFVCVQMNFDKTAIGNWIKNVFSVSFTPVLDLILLMIPMMFSVFFPESWLTKLIICACIIPARRTVKQFLGMSSPGEGLMSAVKAMAALRSVSGMARRTGQRFSRVAENVRHGREDLDRSRMEGELASAEQQGLGASMKNYGYLPTATNGKAFGLAGDENGKKLGMGLFRKKDNETGLRTADSRFGMGDSQEGMTRGEMSDSLNSERNTLQEKNDESSARVARLRSRKADLEKANADFKQKEIERGERGDFDHQIAENNNKIADINRDIAREEANMAENKGRISAIDRSMRGMGLASGSGGHAHGGDTSGIANERQQDILRKHANISNFENPEFSNLSHEDKAELYKKRAKRQFRAAAADATIGTAGAVMGMAAGAAATSFYGPSMQILAADAGHAIGSGVGNVATTVVKSIHKKGSSGLSGKQEIRYVNQMVSDAERGKDVSPMMGGTSGTVKITPPPSNNGGGGSGMALIPQIQAETVAVGMGNGGVDTAVRRNLKASMMANVASAYNYFSTPQGKQTFSNEVLSGISRAKNTPGFATMSRSMRHNVMLDSAVTSIADATLVQLGKGVDMGDAERTVFTQSMKQAIIKHMGSGIEAMVDSMDDSSNNIFDDDGIF